MSSEARNAKPKCIYTMIWKEISNHFMHTHTIEVEHIDTLYIGWKRKCAIFSLSFCLIWLKIELALNWREWRLTVFLKHFNDVAWVRKLYFNGITSILSPFSLITFAMNNVHCIHRSAQKKKNSKHKCTYTECTFA